VSEFRFAEPEWAQALWGVLALVVLLIWLERRGGSALDRLVSGALQARLVARPSAWQRYLRIALLGLALASLVVALMRPQWGLRHVATPRVGAEIMICLDVSKSMLAEDVVPNRLERAKAEIADLLGFLDGDQVGLIAFAGRATVLSPLTPDFGFLRLVLDNVDVTSVTRGGTRIGEAIRKAVKGFGPAGEASRAILLITDGEDHDSFPLDAAREAAEAGLKIIAIGFGDEAGSEILVTDRRTGARSRLLDADGRPVRSRLDGDLLRELALATEGAYVPAGTGVLDLESIYARHIARLTRGQLDARGRTVRDEGYQWAVLLALAFLVSGVAVAAGRASRRSASGASTGALTRAAAVLLALALAPLRAPLAQQPDVPEPAPGAESPAASGPAEGPMAGEGTTTPQDAPPEDPRALYNRGVAALDGGQPEEAETWFRRARREARGDGALRAHSAYNLGWSTVARADALEASDARQALKLLHEAADWFREALQHSADDAEARHNLDVVLKRALLLADQLAQSEEGALEQRLGELAERQRALVAQTAARLGRLDESAGAGSADPVRREFRALAMTQRTVLSDADRLAQDVGEERDAIEARPEEERAPEDAMRSVQLANVLHYLHRARERMGQTRRQLRQRQAERSYRRASAALAELKRALDQLRDPVRVLDTLLREETGLAASTELLAASDAGIPGLEAVPEPPPWLTRDWLGEAQTSVSERTHELGLRLEAGGEAEPPADAEPATARIVAAAREARPFVEEARSQLERAAQQIEADDLDAARRAQLAGIAALLEARERFLDLRGLIEAAYGDEKSIQAIVGEDEQQPSVDLMEFHAGLWAAQNRNLERSERLERMLEEERAGLGAAGGPGEDEEQLAQQTQRLDVARELLDLARGEMLRVREHLGDPAAKARPDWPTVRAASAAAVQHLESLRRLFFSIVEHVREVAERQVDLADQTQDAAALSDADALDQALGALVPPQKGLARRSLELANALEQQSREPGDAVQGEADPAETSSRLRRAAEHVLAAEGEMTAAAGGMESDPPGLDTTREKQQAAVVELQKALALLVPPGQPPQQQEQQQGGGDQDAAAQQEQRSGEESPSMDPAQLLQSVRDREARRRREQAERRSQGYETVEKDW
jgi:Ca-activated chloride channel family protein